MSEIQIGLGKSARQSFSLDDLMLLPGRRTRDSELVDLSWQLDAYKFDLPFMSSAMDSVSSPETVIKVSKLGGLGVLDLEGLWTRHENANELLEELSSLDEVDGVKKLRELYQTPVNPELVSKCLAQIQDAGVYSAGAVSPKHVAAMKDVLLKADLDLLVIRGTVISAEHVSSKGKEPLNLKSFVRELETPVVVGGCVSYQAALHLMRTGAAGVLVGVDSGKTATTNQVTGIGSGMATAVADVRAARMRHLDETGVYVHVIADGGFRNSSQIAKAIACGADGVVLGSVLASSHESPGRGWHWGSTVVHETLSQGHRVKVPPIGSLEEILLGPAFGSDGRLNLFGALKSTMATLGYDTIKDLQKADLVISKD